MVYEVRLIGREKEEFEGMLNLFWGKMRLLDCIIRIYSCIKLSIFEFFFEIEI